MTDASPRASPRRATLPTIEGVTSRRSARPSTGPRHARRLRRHPVARVVAVASVGIAAFTISGAALAYNALQGNIDTHDVTALLGGTRPTTAAPPADPRAGEPFNVLVMGSDVRSGVNAQLGGAPETEGMRSDTTLLVHISAERDRADIVSIPRDLLVDIPSCALADGTTSAGQSNTMFNAAFATGGANGRVEYAAACTIKTVEAMSGVFVHDFVVVDFAGFTSMVNALGGVPMCVPEPVSDRFAGLDLDAGQQVLDGQQALAYARARKSIGDGSDISRIGRQQELLGAMVRTVLSKNLLTDLPALYRFLDAGTDSMTTGPTMGQIPNLVGLANSLRSVPAGGVTFVTLPFDWAGARVAPNADSAALWASIAADERIAPAAVTPSEPETSGSASPDPGANQPDDTPSPAATEPSQPWDFVTGADRSGVCE